METKILTNAEYVEAVLAIQPEVIATTNKKLSKKARKLVMKDYEKWVLQCRDHAQKRCWDPKCPGELEYVLEYKTAEESDASIVTARCKACGKAHRLQDYEENLEGMKGRVNYGIRREAEDLEYKAEEMKALGTKIKEVRKEKNALHLEHVLNIMLAEEIGAR